MQRAQRRRLEKMNVLLRKTISVVLALGGIVCVEQILYRFSGSYASMRADWLWSLSTETAGWLKVLPVDQWKPFPVHDGKASLAARLNAESEYVQTSLSHTRALRDRFYEELLSAKKTLPAEMPALARDGKKGGVYIREPVTANGVKGTILRVLQPRAEYKNQRLILEHRALEEQFTPMMRQSFACGSVHAATKAEILAAVKELNKEDKSLARRILAWGRGESANLLAQTAAESPEIFDALVLESPATMPPMPLSPPIGPFVLFLMDEHTRKPVSWHALEWIEKLRIESLKPGADRFSGLLTDGRTTARDADNYRLALAFGFMTEVTRVSPALAKLDEDSTTAAASPVHLPTGNEPERAETALSYDPPRYPSSSPVFRCSGNPGVFRYSACSRATLFNHRD